MRKLITMAIIIFCSNNIMAQIGKPFSKPMNFIWARTAEIKHFSAGQDADKLYLYQRRTEESRKKSIDNIFVFNKNSLDFTSIILDIPPLFQYIGSINRESDIIALYQVCNHKEGFIGLYSDVIDKSAQSVSITGKCLITFPSESSKYPHFITSVSPNGKYHAVTFMTLDKKGNVKNLYGVVLDQDGNLTWGGKINLNFPNPMFSTEDMQVSNDGTIYIPAYSMTISKNKASNVKLHLLEVNGELLSMNTVDINFGTLQHAKALVLKNGDIFVGGYYQANQPLDDETIGYYGYRFNPETADYIEKTHTDFPADYQQKKVSTIFGSILANQQYWVCCDYLFELENGNVVMTGEHQFVKRIRDANNMVSYIHLNKNILVSTFDTENNSEFTMIEKAQGASYAKFIDDVHNLFLSYTAFADENGVHFIYNEHTDNVPYPGNGKLCETSALRLTEKLKGVCTTLAQDGEILQKVLVSASETGQQLYRLQFVDNEAFYVVAATKNGYCLDKFLR